MNEGWWAAEEPRESPGSSARFLKATPAALPLALASLSPPHLHASAPASSPLPARWPADLPSFINQKSSPRSLASPTPPEQQSRAPSLVLDGGSPSPRREEAARFPGIQTARSPVAYLAGEEGSLPASAAGLNGGYSGEGGRDATASTPPPPPPPPPLGSLHLHRHSRRLLPLPLLLLPLGSICVSLSLAHAEQEPTEL